VIVTVVKRELRTEVIPTFDHPSLSSCPPGMPSSDYTSAGGGLKLKGAKPTGVEKKRKKKSSSKSIAVTTAASSKDATPAKDDTADPATTTDLEQREKNKEESLIPDDGKTEYERRHEETRRKRVSCNATEAAKFHTDKAHSWKKS
jgi:protein FAM32A